MKARQKETQRIGNKISLALALASTLVAASACNQGPAQQAAETLDASVLGNVVSETSTNGEGWDDDFRSDDPNHITLALKYVTYLDDKGAPVISKDDAKTVLRRMNELYSVCNMHFRMEEYHEVSAKDFGLDTFPSSMGDLNTIRQAFDNDAQIVVINTGEWNNAGGLGADGANAWTMMPGQTPSGAVIESAVSKNGALIAHELGHYLDLDHQNDRNNMMNPTIYSYSTTISPDQCQQMRDAALTARNAAVRH